MEEGELHLDHHLLKLPRCEAFSSQLQQAIISIYGADLNSSCSQLVAFLNQSRNRIKAQSFGITIHTCTDYAQLLVHHIQLFQLTSAKLERPEEHYRHLPFKVGWLDTFSGEICEGKGFRLQQRSCFYNLIITGLFVLKEQLQRGNTQAIKNCKQLRHYMRLLLRQGNMNQRGDLSELNLEVTSQLLNACECFAVAKQLETTYSENRKLMPKNIADAFWRADHFYERVNQVLVKNRELFPQFVVNFYRKCSAFYQTFSKLRYYQLMIRHLELYLNDEPRLFEQVLDYSRMAVKVMKGLEARRYTHQQLEILQSYSRQVFEMDAKLKHRNEKVYNMVAMPQSMLPVPEKIGEFSDIAPSLIQEAPLMGKLKLLLEQFWSEEVDSMAYQLCQLAVAAVKEIDTGMKQVGSNINQLQQDKFVQKQRKVLKVVIIESKRMVDHPNLLIDEHASCQRRFEELVNKLNQNPDHPRAQKVRKWVASTKEKLRSAEQVNRNVIQKTEANLAKIKLLQEYAANMANCPSLEKLQQRLQLLHDRATVLEEMVRVNYQKKLMEKSKKQSLDVALQQMKKEISEIKASWLGQIAKIQKYVNCTEELTKIQCKELIDLIEARRHGLQFYRKLLPETLKVQESFSVDNTI